MGNLFQILYGLLIDFLIVRRSLAGTNRSHFRGDGATAVSNSKYYILNEMFKYVEIKEDEVVVDIGCGKGRVICWLLYKKYKNRIIGIEIEPEVAQRTRHHFRRYPHVEIRNHNILDHLPVEGDFYYLFNPFERSVAVKLKERMEETYLPVKKKIRILYSRSGNYQIFLNDVNWKVELLDGFSETALIELKV